jgi:hypothetical protein
MVFNNKPVEEAVIVVTYQPTMPIGSAHFFHPSIQEGFRIGEHTNNALPNPRDDTCKTSSVHIIFGRKKGAL